MHVTFTEQEREWLLTEPFKWRVKDGAPPNIKKSIHGKLTAIERQGRLRRAR